MQKTKQELIAMFKRHRAESKRSEVILTLIMKLKGNKND